MEETNLNKIIHLTYITKSGKVADRYIYLVESLDDDKDYELINIAGKLVALITVSNKLYPYLVKAEADKEVMLGETLAMVGEIITEEELIQRDKQATSMLYRKTIDIPSRYHG